MLLMFCAFTAIGAGQYSTSQTNDQAHKAAAQQDQNNADQEKADAKNAGTKAGEDRDKVMARLDDSSKILNELLGAPDKGIPDKVFEGAKCVAVVPSMVKGGFVFGAEHGRGVATCRTANGWSAPASSSSPAAVGARRSASRQRTSSC